MTAASSGNPGANAASVDQSAQVQYILANTTAQISNGLRSRVSYNNSWSKTDGLLPAQTGSDPIGTNYSKISTFPNWTLSGNLDWVATPTLFFGIRGGYYNSDRSDSNVTNEPRYIFSSTNIGLAGVPVDMQRVSGLLELSGGRVQRNDPRPADARELPGRRHGLRQGRRRAPAQVRRAN